MSKREKLRERLKNNPNNVTFSDIQKLLEQEGFVLDRVRGSHHIFTKNEIIFGSPEYWVINETNMAVSKGSSSRPESAL